MESRENEGFQAPHHLFVGALGAGGRKWPLRFMEVIANFIENGIRAERWKGWGEKNTDPGSLFQRVQLRKFSRNLEMSFRSTLPTIFL